MSNNALIIIDVQDGMYDGIRIDPIFEGSQKVQKISQLIEKGRNKGINIIYVQHSGPKGHPLEKDTKGWMIHEHIRPAEGETVIEKNYPDSFQKTRLHEILDELSVSKLFIVGNQTEFCVDTTCRSAFEKGFQVLLIEDCHSTWDNKTLTAQQIIKHHNETLGDGFVLIKNSEDISFDEFEGQP